MKEISFKEGQEKSLDIIVFIDKICKQLGLKYFLAYGTLIGAIRHNGFIPWDDDIDIWMPKLDYVALENYFNEHEEELAPYKMFTKGVAYILWG